MNWEALGAIGEIVGAVAVVLTLGYLAVQIRQNTRSVRASTYQAITSHSAELNAAAIENPELAHMLITGEDDPASLSGEERRRFFAHTSRRFRHYDNLYYQCRTGMLEESQWKGFRRLLRFNLQKPGFVEFWRESSPIFSNEFVEYVESVLRRLEEAGDAGEHS